MADGWADFNDIGPGNSVTVIAAHCNVTPVLGEWFSVGDGDGNWCIGVVHWWDGKVAKVKLDLQSFHNNGVPAPFVRGNPRLAELLDDPTIAAEVRRIETENDEGNDR